MLTRRNPLLLIIQIIVGAALFAGFVWFNYQAADLGRGGDEFYIQWASGRRLAIQAQDPYVGRLTYPIDEGFGGLQASEQSLRFNTPIYSLLFVFPFLLIENFRLAYFVWLVFNGFGLLVLVWGGLSFSSWKPRQPLTWMLFIFIAFSFFTVQAFSSGSLVILGGLLIVLAFLAVQANRLELGGLLFALTSVQPQYFLLLYALLLVWGFSRRKWNFIVWFLAGILILSIVGLFVIPDWVISYLRVVWHFEENFTFVTPGTLFRELLPGLGRQLGWLFTLFMGLICGAEWFIVRGKEVRWLFWTVCLTLVASQWIGLPVTPSEFFVLMIPVILIVSTSTQRAGKPGVLIIGLLLVILLLVPWWIALGAGLPMSLVRPGWGQFFLMPLTLIVGLYWTRWWAIRPQRLYIEELRSNETV